MSKLYKKLPIQRTKTLWSGSLAAQFHESTKYTPATAAKVGSTISQYMTNPTTQRYSLVHFKDYTLHHHLQLPEVKAQQCDLTQLMFSRHSQREFSPTSLQISMLANTLGQALKTCRYYQLPDHVDAKFGLRPYPSGGGLYPCEVYLIALRVEGLNSGIYNYQSHTHQLAVVAELPEMSKLQHAFMNDPMLDSVAAVVVITAIMERSYIKYADRAYRLALLEAGHLAQNIVLSSQSHGIASIAWGGFFDDKIVELLGCNPIDEPVLHAILLGS